jgi:hypothetical protein
MPHPPTRLPLLRPAFAVDLLFVLLCAWLFLFTFISLDHFDPDAHGIVAHFRVNDGLHGWTHPYAFIALSMTAVNALVNASGLASNDYLLAFRLVIHLATLAMLGCTYAALFALTRRRVVALVFSLILALLPGLLDLAVIGEDNLFASMMNMQYLLVYLLTVKAWGRGSHVGRDRRRFFVFLLSVSLVAALLTHRSLNVLWVTPLFLPWLARRRCNAACIRLPVAVYLISAAGFVAAFALLTWWRAGELTWEHFRFQLVDWVFPNPYYQGFYFYNRYGWDLLFQFDQVMKGVGRLISHTPFRGQPLGYLYLAFFIALILPFLKRRARPRRVWLAPLLLAAVHVPHSLIFESENLERWDAIAPPLAVLAGVLALHLHRRVRLPGNHGGGWLLAPLLLAVAAHNALYRQELAADLRRHAAQPRVRAMTLALRERCLPPARNWDRPPVFVIAKEDYNRNPMLSSTYYAWDDELFILYADGAIDRPGQLFPRADGFRPLPLADFFPLLETRHVVGTPAAFDRLERLRRGEFAVIEPPTDPQSRREQTVPPGTRFQNGGPP